MADIPDEAAWSGYVNARRKGLQGALKTLR
jgi:hypothetical protein